MIRTLQDHGIHQGIDVHMECTVVRAAQGRRPRRRARSATTASAAASVCFEAKAVVLATGGIGRAYKITSNSWEYTGDGHALAYDAGAELHGHGVRPVPSDRHGLAAERARHPGDRRRARRGRRPAQQARASRFMFDDIPENYRSQTADNEEEGWRYTPGRQERAPAAGAADARPRRALHRARGASEGRGSPHGGVFLDIAWIKEKLPNAAEHIKKKLPSMYHQFKELARHRHHQGADGGRPTTHYIMGGVRVDGDTQMSTRAGPVRGRRVRRRAHGANRLGGNSLSDLLVFGKRAGEYAAQVRQGARRAARSTRDQVDEAAQAGAGAVRARRRRRGPVPDPARPAGR